MGLSLRTKKLVDRCFGGFCIVLLRPLAVLLGKILNRDHSLEVRGDIVWIKLQGGGSFIIAYPAILGLRKKFPQSKFVVITTPSIKPFVELMGVFDEIRLIQDSGVLKLLLSSLGALRKTLWADHVIDLEVYSRLTTVFSTLSMARNRISFWLEDIYWRKHIASHLIFFNRFSGVFEFYKRTAEILGAQPARQEECRQLLEEKVGAKTIKLKPGRVCIGFACSDLAKERMLSPEEWVSVFKKHLHPGLKEFYFLGGSGDHALGEKIILKLQYLYPNLPFINSCGKMKLSESVAHLYSAEEFWGIDSSLLHFARVIGMKCISYWGPTDPSTLLCHDWPLDEKVYYRKIACSPCVHVAEEPPCYGDNRCIKQIFSDRGREKGWSPVFAPISSK